jgi:hypothetical protein
MTTKNPTVAFEHVACKMCMKDIPISEAVVSEATGYVAHFCGVQCYGKWRNQPATSKNLPAARDTV